MKTLYKALFTFLLLIPAVFVFAQGNEQIKLLIEQGVALNDSGKYAAAIEKYNEVLKIAPDNERAIYEIAYTLSASGKPHEALPYLEKLIKLNPNSADAYDMLGNIYDDDKQTDKAIEFYLLGIKADPKYQRLYFNMAILYYKLNDFPDAERYAIDAIRLDPKHASSQRIYALATYKLQKRGCSLLAWSSMLMLDPQSKFSPLAYAYIENILNYGIKKPDGKTVNISVSPDKPGNLMMPIAIIAATESKTGLSAVDSLQLQLTSVFKISRTVAGDKEQPFVLTFFADYFEKLAESGNMEAFARIVSLSAYKEDNLKWLKDNDDKLTALNNWIANTKREF